MMVSSSMLGTSSSASLIFALRCFAVTSPSGRGGRVEPCDEHGVQRARDLGIAVEHRRDEILALRDAGLLQIAAIGAQDADCGGAEPGRLGERVVAVIVGLAVPDRQEDLLEQLAAVGEVDRRSEGVLELHVVDEDQAGFAVADLEGALADHPEADVLEDRHAPRQRHRRAVVVDLQRRLLRLLVGVPVVVDGDRILRIDAGDAARIDQRLGGGEGAAIAFGEPRGDAQQRGVGARTRRGLAQRVLPGADDVADRRLDRRLLDLRRLAAGAADDEMDARQPAFREGRIEGREPALEDGLQIGADLLAHDRIVAVARHEDEDRDEAVELVDAEERPTRGRSTSARIASACLRSSRHGDLEQLVARIGFQHVDQRLAGMVGRDRSRISG